MKKYNALDSKCPSCGAQIIWDPAIEKFKCEYCSSEFTSEELISTQDNKTTQNTSTEELISFKCSNCGAEIISDINTFSTFCVYCGSTAILKDKIKNEDTPDYIIPFKKTDIDAKNAYNELLKGKRLLPRKFRKAKMSEKIKGIYIPFWAYDITCNGDIKFDGIDIEKWEDDEYEYEKKEYYDVVVRGHYEYEKVLCDASRFFNDDLMDSISPFKLDELIKYNHAFLCGYLADKYDVSKEESYNIAKERSRNSCISVARRESHHDEEHYEGDNLTFNQGKTYHIYLPVYILNIPFKKKIYTFAMNGQTGKIIGNLPIGKIRYTLSVISFFLAIFLGLFFLLNKTDMNQNGALVASAFVSIIAVIIFGFILHSRYKLVNTEYYAFDYLNEDTTEANKIKDSYTHSSTSKNKKLNSNKD